MALALVTGANGFIGSHLVRALLKEGVAVRGLLQPQTDRRNIAELSAEWVEGDLRDSSALKRAVVGCETVFHLAAYNHLWAPNPEIPLILNARATETLLAESEAAGVETFVYADTATLYRRSDDQPATEKDRLVRPPYGNHYEVSKYFGGQAVKAYADRLRTITLAPTAPVGPGDLNLTGPGRMIVDFMQGKLPAILDTGLNFVDVRDVATAFVKARSLGESGDDFILGGENLRLEEILQVLSRHTGRRAPTWKIPYWVALLSAHASEAKAKWITKKPPTIPLEGVRLARRPCYYDCRKAERVLGLVKTDIFQCTKDAIEWFQENHFC